MFIWTTLRGRLPKERLPQRFFAQGELLAKKIFPQEAFVQERPSLPRRPFLSKKMSTPLEPLFRDICVIKDTLWQSMWFGAECWQNRNQTLGDCSKRKVDLQTKEQLWNFLLLRTWFYFSQAIQSYVQQREKGILCCSILLQWNQEDYKVILFLLLPIS